MDAKTIYKSRKRKIIKCSFHHGGKNTFHASKAWFSSNSPNSSFSLLGSTGSCSLPVSSGRLLLTESIVSRVAVPFVSGSKKHRPAQTKASTATMEYGKRMWIRIYWENKTKLADFTFKLDARSFPWHRNWYISLLNDERKLAKIAAITTT